MALDFGIVNGDVNGNYKPDEYITRRDVAIMIANALTYLEINYIFSILLLLLSSKYGIITEVLQNTYLPSF